MRFGIARVSSVAVLALAVVHKGAMSHTAFTQDELVYVKKDSRDATRQASLEASGAIRWPSTWQLIRSASAAEINCVIPGG